MAPFAAHRIHRVGDVIPSFSSANPALTYGGSWVLAAVGRALVGIDPGQVEFDTARKIGGAKTHTLTAGEMPQHTHAVTDAGHSHTIPVGATDDTAAPFDRADAGSNTAGANATTNTGSATTGITLGNTGGGGAHNNLPPYIALYVWEKTA